MNTLLPSLFCAAALLLPHTSAQVSPPPPPGNVLILIADDLGVDKLGVYGEGTQPPATPHIDALAERGVLFRKAWSNPVCSPTRATVLTGRYSFRNTVGEVVSKGNAGLPLTEFILPELLNTRPDLGYSHAWIGKWHLQDVNNGGLLAANLAGFQHYAGAQNGIYPNRTVPSQLAYYQWDKVTNGERSKSTTYNTVETVDDALSWISETDSPWVCFVAFCAPHTPIHEPPAELHTVELPELCAHDAPVPYFNATMQTLDHEIGRLLHGLNYSPGHDAPETTVIFLGDNGTTGQVATPPFNGRQAKGTIFEGGIRVPLIVAGPHVAKPGSECDALVNTTDIYATVAEIAGIDLNDSMPTGVTLDSVSLFPYLARPELPSLRSYAFAESFRPNGTSPTQTSRTIRDHQYKFVRIRSQGTPDNFALYDLLADPFERTNLLRAQQPPRPPEIQQAMSQLRDALNSLLSSP